MNISTKLCKYVCFNLQHVARHSSWYCCEKSPDPGMKNNELRRRADGCVALWHATISHKMYKMWTWLRWYDHLISNAWLSCNTGVLVHSFRIRRITTESNARQIESNGNKTTSCTNSTRILWVINEVSACTSVWPNSEHNTRYVHNTSTKGKTV